MANGINKVILVGHLGRDPEIREFNNGKQATFTLATTESYKKAMVNESIKPNGTI